MIVLRLILGTLLVGIGAFAYVHIPERSDWPALILMMAGMFIIDRKDIVALAKAAAKYAPKIRS